MREYRDGETHDPRGHQVMMRVDDVRAVLDAARRAGADAGAEPHDYEYGERQAAFVDPFGHEWVLTETLRDVDPQEWGGATVPWTACSERSLTRPGG
ncbi:VOC family protein [Nocardioides cheoyonin]|uniref:VOC family protein n=1 Tax=Nocardioides cheoyonin TaxID=3156615 RepID=UPI003CCC6D80